MDIPHTSRRDINAGRRANTENDMTRKTLITLGIIAIAVAVIAIADNEEASVAISNGEVNVTTANGEVHVNIGKKVSVSVGEEVHVGVGGTDAKEVEVQTEQ